jgi:Flp pilus assembly protein TadD
MRRATHAALLTLALAGAPLVLPRDAAAQEAEAPDREAALRAALDGVEGDARLRPLQALSAYLEEKGRWQEAAATWREALRLDESVVTLRGYARTLMAFAESVLSAGASGAETKAAFVDARLALQRARKAGAGDLQVGLDLARCCDALEMREAQIAELRKLAEAYPDDDRPRRALAFALLVAGEDAEALPLFQKLSNASRDDAQLARGFSHVASRTGNEKMAVSAAKRAVLAAPHWVEAWSTLWRLFAPERRFGELSAVALELAEGSDASAPGAHYAGFALSYAGRFDEALPWLRKAWELDPGNDNARLEAARILREERRDREGAVALYVEVLDRTPGHKAALDGLFFIARQVAENDSHEAAVPLFERVALYKQDDGRAWADLALALRWSGRYDEARATYLKAIRVEPDDAQIRNDYGLLLLVMDRPKEASATFLAGLEVDELHNDCMENLGFMARARGDREEALEWFLRGWRAALRRNEDGARHRRNTDDLRWPLPSVRRVR